MSPQPAKIFDPVSKTLHWLAAFGVLAALALGGVMSDFGGSPEVRRALYTSHKTLGVLILLLAVFRLYWRHKSPAPPLPTATMPRWQILAARAVHIALHLLMLAVPLAGWAMVSAGPHGIELFGLIPFPNMPLLASLENAGEVRHAFKETHEGLAGFMALLVALHIAAALKHHFISRDDILIRMSPVCMGPFLNKLRNF